MKTQQHPYRLGHNTLIPLYLCLRVRVRILSARIAAALSDVGVRVRVRVRRNRVDKALPYPRRESLEATTIRVPLQCDLHTKIQTTRVLFELVRKICLLCMHVCVRV